MLVASYHNTDKKTTKIATLADRSHQHNERQTAMQFSYLAIAALAAMSMIGAVAGADDITTSHHRASVVITSDATVGDGVPATVPATATATAPAPRKLMKNSKASNANALSQDVDSLLGNIVFTKAMELYRFSVQPSSDDTARAGGAVVVVVGMAIILANIGEAIAENNEEICELCLNFLWDQDAQHATENEQYAYCQNVVLTIMDNADNADPPFSDDNEKSMMTSCMKFSQCPSRNTNLACCQSQRACIGYQIPPVCSASKQIDPNYCKLSCDSGSCENYFIQTETKTECDTDSTALGCGACKDKGPSDAILQQARMPTDGFVSLCVGGPCVWTEQTTQCMGLKKYSTITTASACKDACCGDDTCAVWQFDAKGYSDQCWYGTNCDVKGGLTWTNGGIRKMGTDQTPDCVDQRSC